jgi:hypothetical protein
MHEQPLSRKSVLRLAGLTAASLGTGAWKAREALGGGPAAVESGAVSCVLTPEMTEGPYYIAGEKLRRNITDGHAGTPLVLQLTVVDASTCKPIKGATVDIWHADAAGAYDLRGYKFRGALTTSARGEFHVSTIIPGMRRRKHVEQNLAVSDRPPLMKDILLRLRKHRWVRTYDIP